MSDYYRKYECERCYADMRTKDDPDGTGNYSGGEYGWVCDQCLDEIEWEREHEEECI